MTIFLLTSEKNTQKLLPKMDCDSIYNKRGRILSFEEARSLYLERNPGRASFHEGHNPTSHLRHPTHSQLVHGGAVPNASTVYWANQGGTASVGANQGSLGRGSTFVRSMSPSGKLSLCFSRHHRILSKFAKFLSTLGKLGTVDFERYNKIDVHYMFAIIAIAQLLKITCVSKSRNFLMAV